MPGLLFCLALVVVAGGHPLLVSAPNLKIRAKALTISAGRGSMAEQRRFNHENKRYS